MSEELKPCKICGHLPEKYETRSHVIIECQSDDDDNPNDYHRLFVARRNQIEANTAWNQMNRARELQNESGELPEWIVTEIQRIRNFVAMSRFGDWKCDLCYDSECFQAVKAGIDRYLTLVLSLRKPEDK